MAGLYSTLLNEIKRLYHRITLAILHKRVGSYHHHSRHDDKPHASDLKSSLLDYIDNVEVTGEPPPRIKFSVESIIPKHIEPNQYHYEKHGDPNHVVEHRYTGDLSKYFKSRRKSYQPEPDIKDKLEHSVWEHINASIQCAHHADKRNAKMHVDIAMTAFKEVARFLPEEEYKRFSEKVGERLAAMHVNQ